MKRSFFKKLIVLTLSIAMLLMSVLPMTIASAAETATVTATPDKSSYAVGETVVINVAVDSATVKSIGLSWTYDNTALEFVSGAWTINGAIADVEEEAPRAAFAYEAATETAGNIFALTFTVLKDDADTTVTVTPVLKNGTTVIDAAAAVATVSFACEHENLGNWVSDETAHWKECECGEVLDKDTHDFANACDANCDTCGYVRVVAGHVYDNDCDTDCNTCGETRMVGDHVYDNACDATCNSCGATREVGDHAYGDYQSTEDGHFKVCTECSNQTATEPHDYDNACDFDCNVCGAVRNVDGHEFSETYTFDENGHWFECSICGEKTDVLPHAFDNDCDDKCDTCGYTREVAGHQFGAYEYNDLTHWKKCSICGTVSEDGDHNLVWETTIEATNKQAGEKVGTCTCGYTKTEKIRRVLKFSTRNLALANKIAVNFKLAAEYITTEGYSDPYVMYSVGGSELERLDYYLDDTNRPTFTISVNPQLMTADMELYLYAMYDGELVAADVYNFKVIDYIYSQLNGASANNVNMRTLLVDLLHYGSAVQQVAGYNTDKLANAQLTATQDSWRTPISYSQADYIDSKNNKYVLHENPSAVYKTLALALDSAVEIKFGMEIKCDLANVKLYATNGQLEWEIPSSEFVYDPSNGRYYVYFNMIEAHQMDDVIDFTFYDGDTAISNTYRYSVESYVYSNIEKASNTATLKLALATMMNYGRSADRCSG